MWKGKLVKLYDTAKNAPFVTTFAVLNGLGLLYYMDKNYREQLKHYTVVPADRVKVLKTERVQAEIKSIRNEAHSIQKAAEYLERGRFILVRGPRGVGKTSAICTALESTKGVIKIGPVRPGTTQDEILDEVSYRITGLNVGWKQNADDVAKVSEKFKEDNKKCPLIVLIQASERPVNDKAAELTAAARILADLFGLAVIIDCCENACPPTLTGREILVNFEPMSFEQMQKLTNDHKISKELEREGNTEIVLAVCGGRPLLLDDLLIEIRLHGSEHAVKKFVMSKIAEARENISVLCRTPGVKEVLEKFKDHAENSSDIFPVGQTMPDMKQVLRKVLITDRIVLVPATGAVALQLRMGIENKASFEEIKQWINKQKPSVKASLLFKESTGS